MTHTPQKYIVISIIKKMAHLPTFKMTYLPTNINKIFIENKINVTFCHILQSNKDKKQHTIKMGCKTHHKIQTKHNTFNKIYKKQKIKQRLA